MPTIPEPNSEPQPPTPEPPKGRHPLAYLIFVLPSVFTWLPTIFWGLFPLDHRSFLTVATLALLPAALSCFGLGILLEYWLHKDDTSALRAFGLGFCLLIFNSFLSFAGCAMLPTFIHINHSIQH